MNNFTTLPEAVIFDLDGVITNSAKIHKQAWESVFNQYFNNKKSDPASTVENVLTESDYLKYIDGKPRYEGVNSFLKSRNIYLNYGSSDEDPGFETVCSIGNLKNDIFNKLIKKRGVEIFSSTVELMHKLKHNGVKIGIASSSRNCKKILKASGLDSIADTVIDGEDIIKSGINGKPHPDIFLSVAETLNVSTTNTVVVEDANSGVEAGRKGGFGLIIGIARNSNDHDLYCHGADIVINDLADLGLEEISDWFKKGKNRNCFSIIFHGYNKSNERLRETLLSIGNGFFGTRGASEECGFTKNNYPGTYISGVYNTLDSVIEGKKVLNEDFVNVTNWLPVTFKINNGSWFDINNADILSFKRELSFIDGLLTRELVYKDKDGRKTVIISKRFASMHTPKLAAIQYSVTPLNYSGQITFSSQLSGNHINDGVKRYRGLNQEHLKPVNQCVHHNVQCTDVITNQSNITIRQTAIVKVETECTDKEVNYIAGKCDSGISEIIITSGIESKREIRLEKLVWIESLPEGMISDKDPYAILDSAGSFDNALKLSAIEWGKIWDKIDIEIEGDRFIQKLVRLHLYHIICTTSPNNKNIDFGIPARGLTGEAYRGHIFWDELYILPFYCFHFPEVSRSVLMYRYRRLEKAREYASKNGYKGAMYPWQSGSKGDEQTQLIHYNPVSKRWDDDNSSLQRHVSLAIAYNIIKYFDITEDIEFIELYGMEMLLEICRFWCSKAQLNDSTGRYSIVDVMGPDEFHEGYPDSNRAGLKDNAYTNVLSSWLFKKVPEIFHRLKPDVKENLITKINIKKREFIKWKKISKKLNVNISPEGIIEQFDGYFKLKELDWKTYKEKYHNIQRIDRILKAENDSPNRYKVAKQPDTLMLFYLFSTNSIKELIEYLGYDLPTGFERRNFDYYYKRTTHGSTLSMVVHAHIASRLNMKQEAYNLFTKSLKSDYCDIQNGTTGEGIHTGVMAASIITLIEAFGGLIIKNGLPSITPNLPGSIYKLKFSFGYRNKRYSVFIDKNGYTLDEKI